ncbi:MAG: carboxypeptidase regulatory-like domain-containing protein, partial [Terriglobia bacterium]
MNLDIDRLRRQPVLWVLAALAFLVFFANPSTGWCQEATAGITGSVTDPSGAAIAGAKVTAKDMAQGTVWPTQTNTAGIYDLPRLPVGTYSLTIEANGFQSQARSNITLELNQKARVDAQMTLGSVSQTVEVTGAPPLLQTQNTQVGTIINSMTTTTLPLATRNYIQLTLLVPGSTNPNPQTMMSGDQTANAGRPYINGNREQANNFLLDGADNNQVSDNMVGYVPSVDAIQEFNMITANASAEFGNFMGGIVNATIKSGTDSYHGDAFEFVRNDAFNAAQWSQNLAGAPKSSLRWNMFGGSMGGPIKKDKLFFFADYQGQRFDTPASVNGFSVFTAADRHGDFSQLCSGGFSAAGICQKGIQLYNPNSVANGQRQPFLNNRIPITMIDPVAAKLLASPLYPAPINGNLTNNQFNATSSSTDGDQGDIKIDYNASQKDHISGRFSESRNDLPLINSQPLLFNSFQHTPTFNSVIDWTRSISPSLVNEARVAVNRVKVDNGGDPGNAGNVADQFGIANGNATGPGLMALNFSGGFAQDVGNSNMGTQQEFHDTVFQGEDNLIITHGRHILHTGFQIFHDRLNQYYSGNNGRTGLMDFDGHFTSGPNPLSAGGATVGTGVTSGVGEADFFLGMPDTLGLGVIGGTWGQRSNIIAGYLQDDWRTTDNLTLNLGLRYEDHTPWVEVHNRQANFGLFNGTEYLAGQGNCGYSNCRALYNNYNLGADFQPRLGFAWTPKSLGGNTVLRGAYTIS